MWNEEHKRNKLLRLDWQSFESELLIDLRVKALFRHLMIDLVK